MKTKKIIVYGLISFLVFSPLFNFETWASSRTLPMMMQPIMMPASCPVIVPVCFELGNDICCEAYCCTSTDYSNCVLRGGAPVCSPKTGTGTNALK
jgi:hypothetical protein